MHGTSERKVTLTRDGIRSDERARPGGQGFSGRPGVQKHSPREPDETKIRAIAQRVGVPATLQLASSDKRKTHPSVAGGNQDAGRFGRRLEPIASETKG
jgi:hypothetical protein